ncbi:hypothetical protein DEJ28_15235 [Curtobacterium sp. MCPF17_002]|uniref:hypothetical protein n=1 Tax=Curtobacterium sp. MCPF17_002 TaxID=2175645 RepID=UPI0011B734DB|nr:hypothetical protein [Curtobacterium sp. MCPF17_002]WIB76991.1 hypothetical protein DEJ28_15235 [Curtobacterium sp. MCPF17_002]
MNWQEVLDVGRADAAEHRRQATLERANAAHCASEAKTATDTDSGVLWLMRAMQQRSAAVSSDAASDISDRIADHADRVLNPSP